MAEFINELKQDARFIASENILFSAALGISGAAVFTCGIPHALTASVTALAAAVFASAVLALAEKFVSLRGIGADVVFFASAAAATSLCGVVIKALLPSVWGDIGACFPLFAVGSQAVAASWHGRGADAKKRLACSIMLVCGYGAALLAVAVSRALLGLVLPAADTPFGALILAGIIAAALAWARGSASVSAFCGRMKLAISARREIKEQNKTDAAEEAGAASLEFATSELSDTDDTDNTADTVDTADTADTVDDYITDDIDNTGNTDDIDDTDDTDITDIPDINEIPEIPDFASEPLPEQSEEALQNLSPDADEDISDELSELMDEVADECEDSEDIFDGDGGTMSEENIFDAAFSGRLPGGYLSADDENDDDGKGDDAK